MADEHSELLRELRDFRRELGDLHKDFADARVEIANLPQEILNATNSKIEKQAQRCRREWQSHHQVSMLKLLLYLSLAGVFGGVASNGVAALVKSLTGG